MSGELAGAQNWSELYKEKGACPDTFSVFSAIILDYYLNQGRQFSWRQQISPYRVLVSEIMLQQTQTIRVESKFDAFIRQFPGFNELASASFGEVLALWKGLGYNRRAKYLHDIARLVVSDFGTRLPDEPKILIDFPGIGKATAASICVFAYNRAFPFIETNIRTVFIHFFFSEKTNVTDAQIMKLVESTIDKSEPRQWFYGLMDYGVMLKKQVGNLNRLSRHYTKQSRFAGSDRQLRGKILQLLLDTDRLAPASLPELLNEPAERISILVDALKGERLITEKDGVLFLE